MLEAKFIKKSRKIKFIAVAVGAIFISVIITIVVLAVTLGSKDAE
jgi:ABC-type lipoprotein release transport system permease subunit